MGSTWIPVIDMTRDEGRSRTHAVALVENIIGDLPQFVLDRLKFIWITEVIDSSALRYLRANSGAGLPSGEICGALIADDDGRYLELYWQAINHPQPNGWWEERGISDPGVMSIDDRIRLVVYHLMLSLLREVLHEVRNEPVSSEAGQAWPCTDSIDNMADMTDTEDMKDDYDLPELPVFKPQNHPNRLSGYRVPINRIMHFLGN